MARDLEQYLRPEITVTPNTGFAATTIEQVNITTPIPLTEADKEAIEESHTQDILDALEEEGLSEDDRQDLLVDLEKAIADAEKEIEETETPTAVIQFVVYSYKGE